MSLIEIEQIHTNLFNELYPCIRNGFLSREEERVERFRRLFLHFGEVATARTVEAAVFRYRQAYQASRRAVPGSIPLLKALKPQASVAVITNNSLVAQRERLESCGLSSLVDTLIASDEVGAVKPEPAIFETALARVSCNAKEAIMIGDSWSADIEGAHNAGIRAIWLNRYGISCPDPARALEINSLEPTDFMLDILIGNGSEKQRISPCP